jgi:hypothetical protein
VADCAIADRQVLSDRWTIELGGTVSATDPELTVTELQENNVGFLYTGVKDFTGSLTAEVGTQAITIDDGNMIRDAQVFASITEITKEYPGGWRPHTGAAHFSIVSVTPDAESITITIRVEWKGHEKSSLPFRLTYFGFNPSWAGKGSSA